MAVAAINPVTGKMVKRAVQGIREFVNIKTVWIR